MNKTINHFSKNSNSEGLSKQITYRWLLRPMPALLIMALILMPLTLVFSATDAGPVSSSKKVASAKPTPASIDRSLLDIYQAGGIWMHPILLCSMGAVACGVWSGWFVRRSLMLPTVALAAMREHASSGNVTALRNLCLGVPSPLSLALLGALESSETTAVTSKEMMEQQASETLVSEENRYQRWVNFLNVFAQLAPMLGLLGTVVGMIQSFDQLAHGRSDPSDLAGGIGVAMITTAGGLIVAIPAMFAYFCFRAKLVALMDETNQEVGRLIQKIVAAKERVESGVLE